MQLFLQVNMHSVLQDLSHLPKQLVLHVFTQVFTHSPVQLPLHEPVQSFVHVAWQVVLQPFLHFSSHEAPHPALQLSLQPPEQSAHLVTPPTLGGEYVDCWGVFPLEVFKQVPLQT